MKTGVNYQRCLSGKEIWIIRGWLGLHWVMAAIVDCSACLFQIESIENISQWSSGSGAGNMLLRWQTLSDVIKLKDKIGE
jgi:hypothetical protein